MIARDPASARQIQAALPDRSTWLSANAGSGKTRVLTDRVARLLLDGVSPQNVLCLTYTKAAASEMQNRLFKRLGEWAMLADSDLRTALARLGVEDAIDSTRLARARTLFASAIETPGGLKIQTIHSFCASLLRRFPLEAGVSPQFQEIEDRNGVILRDEVIQKIAEGPDAAVLERVAYLLTDETFRALTQEVARHQDLFARPLEPGAVEAALNLAPDVTVQDVLDNAFTDADLAFLPELIEMLRSGTTKGDQTALEQLSGIGQRSLAALAILEDRFLTKSGKAPFTPAKFPGKDARSAHPHLVDRIDDWQQRVCEWRDTRVALAARDKALALHDFARIFLPAYAAAKEARGWLDFDDLILRTRDLLTNTVVSQWVLWRLDGGIDHILVDEAQDTSPVQWQVVSALAREFTSGAGARDDVMRTIFVVGDKKQSIYSFQGADPSEFDRMREAFGDSLRHTGEPLQSLELEYSFRSASTILNLVDRVFDGREAAGFTTDQRHRAFKEAMPGRVDLWPLVEKSKDKDEREWFDPVDLLAATDHNVVLAQQIAHSIRDMLASGQTIPEEVGHSGTYVRRPIRAGDIMILVRGRSTVFNELIRACKKADLPIAGADRLKVAAELAVRDIGALLNFLALPEDDLSLASVLKSPLFGWDEQALYDLAHKRGDHKRLWEAMKLRSADYPATIAMLTDLLEQADFLRPYDLIERILTRFEGRRKLLGRLGEEAEDGIDALLDQALVYERTEVPSLTGFLVWMEADELEIKRQLDSAGNQIRVMTVHGAKGLESPIVILPETLISAPRFEDKVVPAGSVPLWSMSQGEAPAAYRALREEKIERLTQERDRLLYVAMTRAEKWLIVAGAGTEGKSGADWYSRIRDSMIEMGAGEHEHPGGQGLRLENGAWDELDLIRPQTVEPTQPMLESWATEKAPRAEGPARTLSPSDLGGAKALPGEAGLDEDAAKRRGRQVHLLLEHLPLLDQAEWEEQTERLLADGPDAAVQAERALLLQEARRVLTSAATSPFFEGTALAEVSITATLPELGGQRIHGTIDRLIVADDHVLAVDFKTNVVIPETASAVPAGLLRQMGAYASALSQIYPDLPIRTAILWTRNATLMPLPHDIVIAALQDSPPA
ncbi:double-strand break repair helicase AddA [Pseudooceanicola sediminis]|uniref:DNA 3'-5' helicase n=1 Tax=Pseudooceanicola sediminis TaxID=2211117 RepID=A0A399J511_9RHOB|nr:double-strand break repair helicase AddA [Pseudooceanicola sediminis]KAA2315462.1 double-strand break repair helicase AddA [Puniceibacterium sp. HSS470]RII40330.1 double-strand break repair helicase AddA [Pseudooceanicola sediminis]|tara:strand:+ start:24304 stop:27684 length:3381 start_codon:yes stop_codon:yes gene_type:complete